MRVCHAVRTIRCHVGSDPDPIFSERRDTTVSTWNKRCVLVWMWKEWIHVWGVMSRIVIVLMEECTEE